MIQFEWQPYTALTLNQLYSLLQLRSQVFVVEQNCIYLDPDGKDEIAIHLLGYEDKQLVAYLRVFPPNPTRDHIIFGRIVTANKGRRKGYGKQLMTEMLSYCSKHYPDNAIECSAQLYLQSFYESFGLQSVGVPYDEDGILHIHMRRP